MEGKQAELKKSGFARQVAVALAENFFPNLMIKLGFIGGDEALHAGAIGFTGQP